MFSARCFLRLQSSVKIVNIKSLSLFPAVTPCTKFSTFIWKHTSTNIYCTSKRSYVPTISEIKVPTAPLAKRIIRKKKTGDIPGVSIETV
jgi:hypothetical protein